MIVLILLTLYKSSNDKNVLYCSVPSAQQHNAQEPYLGVVSTIRWNGSESRESTTSGEARLVPGINMMCLTQLCVPRHVLTLCSPTRLATSLLDFIGV